MSERPLHPEPHAELDGKRLPFTEHLRELRTRTIRAVAYVVVAFAVAWAFHEQLFMWLMEPYSLAVFGDATLAPDEIAFRSLIEPIVVYLKTSLLVGAIVVTPLILLEAWLFIAPGLYKHERRLALPFLLSSVVFFLGGSMFCRYIVLEPSMSVLLGLAGESMNPTIMMEEYFSFTSKMLFVFGALFELPVAVAFLSMVGLVSHRGLIRNWKFAIVVAFVVGAMMTPPDPLTQIALAVPLVVLYILSIGIAWFIDGRRTAAPPVAPVESE